VSELLVFRDKAGLVAEAARRFAALARTAIAERGRFVVALSGGSTPRPVYALLAEEPLVSQVDWARVHIFWGDERCVLPDHADSNYRMASDALLDRVAIPLGNVHRVHGERPPDEAAALYEAELAEVLERQGRFDLILLGMGADGHTASLFPDTAALDERERDVVPVYVDKLAAWRVTLTLPVINAARSVIFLVSGAGKAPVLARVHGGEELPASLVQPTDGELIWLVDRDAASDLPPNRA
jgi:6-phosphogluconolactonase